MEETWFYKSIRNTFDRFGAAIFVCLSGLKIGFRVPSFLSLFIDILSGLLTPPVPHRIRRETRTRENKKKERKRGRGASGVDASRDSRDISLRIDFVSSIKSGIEPKGGEEEWSRWNREPRCHLNAEALFACKLNCTRIELGKARAASRPMQLARDQPNYYAGWNVVVRVTQPLYSTRLFLLIIKPPPITTTNRAITDSTCCHSTMKLASLYYE